MDGTVKISQLPLAEEILPVDLLVLEQNGTAKKLEGSTFTRFIDRNIVSVSVYQLDYGVRPTAEYDPVTGKLKLGIPAGNGIASIALNKNNQVVYTWSDGSSIALETVKGDTGKSAYQYAVEQGYDGSETDFATLQVTLYQAAAQENQRVAAESQRAAEYSDMMGRLENKLSDLDRIENRLDCTVAGTTLVLNLIDTSVVDTTLML